MSEAGIQIHSQLEIKIGTLYAEKDDVMDYQTIVGTWHRDGFHGHFRNRSRNEVFSQYRYYAKPKPPAKFLDRAKVRSNHHLFSSHDNRNSHSSNMKDLETHFTLGLGKRKPAQTQHTKSTRNLLNWISDAPTPSYETNYAITYNPMNKYMIKGAPSADRRIKSADIMPTNTFTMIPSTAEPVHVRGNPSLKRRVLTASFESKPQRKPPLLAWSCTEMDSSYHKPCIGDPMRRAISREKLDSIEINTCITSRRQ